MNTRGPRAGLTLLALLLLGQQPFCPDENEEKCDAADNDGDGLVDEDFDYDGDGYLDSEACADAYEDYELDCDETDITSNPEGQERCDERDNDCDSLIDESVDFDEDGFFCGDDCDDFEAEAYPGAEELCDGIIDHDCDGSIDEGPDADGDGLSECQGDCDDSDSSIFPGGEEVAGDAVDNNCDGRSEVSFYVNETGISPEEGAEAYQSVQEAISAAASGDVIAVGPGIYRERINFSGKSLHLFSLEGEGQTYLDGAKGGSVVTIALGEGSGTRLHGFTVMSGESDFGGGILVEGSSALIENCTVLNNIATEGGGGVAAIDANLELKNVILQYNDSASGAGLYLSNSTASLEGSRVEDNSAHALESYTTEEVNQDQADAYFVEVSTFEGQGGGAYVGTLSELVIQDSSFSYNYALHGGGIYHVGSNLSLKDTDFVENVGWNIASIRDASDAPSGGGVETEYVGLGGALFLGASASIEGSTISDNLAIHGGGIHASAASVTLEDVDFLGNRAYASTYRADTSSGRLSFYDGEGGGIQAINGAVIDGYNVSMTDDESLYGGAVFSSVSQISLAAFTISGARAEGVVVSDQTNGGTESSVGRGGGIYASGSTLSLAGGAISACESLSTGGALHYAGSGTGSASLVNVGLVDNASAVGGGIHLENSLGSLVFKNMIVAFNRDGGGLVGPLPVGVLTYSNVFGNDGGNYIGVGDKTGVDGNISMDPAFEAFTQDGVGEDNLQLSSNSPCINSGDPNPLYSDADGSQADMGAYGGPFALD